MLQAPGCKGAKAASTTQGELKSTADQHLQQIAQRRSKCGRCKRANSVDELQNTKDLMGGMQDLARRQLEDRQLSANLFDELQK